MEEKTDNIDILEELKEFFDKMDYEAIKHKPEEYKQAISNLIAENKELKEKNKKIDEINFRVNKNLMETVEKLESEKEKNKELENDLKDMTKKYMEAESIKFWYNYIHKDKIRNMLKELEDRRNKQPVIGYWSKKAMLEKLLKEE